MLLLTRKELKSQKDAKECYICGKGIEKKIAELETIVLI